MANKELKLKIITPEKTVLEEMVDQVTLPTTEGEITILPGHIALVSALKAGDLVAKRNDESIPFAIAGGFIEVKNNEVAVLADYAEHVSNLSDAVVAKAKTRAAELQKMKDNGEVVDFEHFASELERSLTNARVADKWRNKKYRI